MSKRFQEGNLSIEFPDFKQIFKPLEDIGHVEVGILGQAKKTSSNKKGKKDVPVAYYASVHEFGDPQHNIPMRSWLRQPLKENFPKYLQEHLADIVKYIMEGRKEEALENLGQEARNTILKAFEDHGAHGEWPPLSDATIARKTKNGRKGDAPLIDTGDMRRSVDYKVVLTNKE